MRLLPLLLTLLITVSCGKDSTSSNSSQDKQEENEVIRDGADGLGIDLLDTIIDVPVDISNSEITFLNSRTSTSEGRRISCLTAVQNGEVYQYSLKGSRLRISTSQGSYSMVRLNNEGSGIQGTWSWKGYAPDGSHIIRTMTFIGTDRAIIKTQCEL